ncbi:hypothetical protein HDU93_003511, partial [Gonapodya sp. JEL0774]
NYDIQSKAHMVESKKLELDVKKDSFVDSVVVFTDRAEVKRIFRGLKISEPGQLEVVMTGVVDLVSDSIRVEGHAKGCTILDVTYATQYHATSLSDDDTTDTVAAGFTKKITELENKKSVLEAEGLRVTKQMQLLETYGSEGVKPAKRKLESPLDTAPSTVFRPFAQDALVDLDSYLEFFGSKAAAFDEKLNSLQLAVKDIEREIEAARKNLEKATARKAAVGFGGFGRAAQEHTNTITVVLEAEASVEAELSVTYVVFNASWKPKYDIRVSSIDEKILKIHYRAEIQQSTGEDWNNAQLSLSTASPALGGDAPEPTKWTVTLMSAPSPPPTYPPSVPRPSTAAFGSATGAGFGSAPGTAYQTAASFGAPQSPYMQQMSNAVARVEGGITTETYQIAARTTVPSDNVMHKVTVAIIKLETKFLHFSYPKSAAYAYLKAKVVNSSDYALLRGPASIFLDNNFVAKSTIKNVSAQETFEASLGVDPSIRITRRPIVKTSETSGLISKSTTWKYSQVIEIRNTKKTDASIVVVEPIPWSGDERLKVTLLEPSQPSQVTAGSTPDERRWLTKKGSDGNPLVTRDEDAELRIGDVQSRMNVDTNCLEVRL